MVSVAIILLQANYAFRLNTLTTNICVFVHTCTEIKLNQTYYFLSNPQQRPRSETNKSLHTREKKDQKEMLKLTPAN